MTRAAGRPEHTSFIRLWAVGASIAAVLGVMFAAQAIGLQLAKDQPAAPLRTYAIQVLPWVAWGLLLPPIYVMAERWPMTRESFTRYWPWYATATVAAPFVHAALVVLPTGWLKDGMSSDVPLSLAYEYVFVNNAASTVVQFALVMVACHAVVATREARARQITETQLVAQLSQAELRALRAQLQPHFLFNTLNAIAAHLRDEPDLAEEMLQRLSELLRFVLGSVGEQEVPLSGELDFVGHYLGIHEMRYGNRLTVGYDVPESLERALVPSFLLQPLVENAVKHGVAARPGAARIDVSAYLGEGGDELCLSVRDQAINFAEATGETCSTGVSGNGIGLSNTRARLQQLYGARQRLELTTTESGALVEISLPLRFAAPSPGPFGVPRESER